MIGSHSRRLRHAAAGQALIGSHRHGAEELRRPAPRLWTTQNFVGGPTRVGDWRSPSLNTGMLSASCSLTVPRRAHGFTRRKTCVARCKMAAPIRLTPNRRSTMLANSKSISMIRCCVAARSDRHRRCCAEHHVLPHGMFFSHQVLLCNRPFGQAPTGNLDAGAVQSNAGIRV